LDPRGRKQKDCRKLHNEELHTSYSSGNIIREIKSRRMSWMECRAHERHGRSMYKILVRKPEGKITTCKTKVQMGR
jgi:hypothetical protein